MTYQALGAAVNQRGPRRAIGAGEVRPGRAWRAARAGSEVIVAGVGRVSERDVSVGRRGSWAEGGKTSPGSSIIMSGAENWGQVSGYARSGCIMGWKL